MSRFDLSKGEALFSKMCSFWQIPAWLFVFWLFIKKQKRINSLK